MDSEGKSLLRALLSVTARLAFTEAQVSAIVAPTASQKKQIKAFNACDGTKSQGEVAKNLKLDHGNFSRTVKRWVEAGVVHRITIDGDDRLLHVFPISEARKLNNEEKNG